MGDWEQCPVKSRAKPPGQGVRGAKSKIFVFISNFKLKYTEIQQEPTHKSHFYAEINTFWAGCRQAASCQGLHAVCGPCVVHPYTTVLFCSLAVLNSRASHTTDILSLFISVLCRSDSSTGSPVHVQMLSTHAVCGLRRLCAPDIVLCIIHCMLASLL